CSQMTSRAEAVFFINNCPNTKMDGDRDGDPCENDTRFENEW
ncbi:excalibur calcium-binding domain-containing protein, partial [Pseudoalteromonas sp. TB6-MNA-CIBAN-0076]